MDMNKEEDDKFKILANELEGLVPQMDKLWNPPNEPPSNECRKVIDRIKEILTEMKDILEK